MEMVFHLPDEFRVSTATITGIDTAGKVSVETRNSSGKWKTISMQHTGAYDYKAEVPADIVTPGIINYRIMVRQGQEQYTFPGAFKGDPYAWDEYRNESWQTFVASPDSRLELFNAGPDRLAIMPYNPDWRSNSIEYITAERPAQLVLKANMNKGGQGQMMGWQFYFGDKIAGRREELPAMGTMVVRARSQQGLPLKIALITAQADAWSVTVPLTREWKEIEIPLNSLQTDSFLLLPRPYPGFLPLRFKPAVTRPWRVQEIEKIEFSFINSTSNPAGLEVESVWLKR
jgi:hypothetical protein